MNFEIKDGYVPGLKDRFMLAHPYIPHTKLKPEYIPLGISPPPLGWWMSEKMDGQRALWNGKVFISRGSGSGLPRVYPYVPKFITDEMPKDILLDGEFYLDRGSFQELGFLRSTKNVDDKWKKIKYQIFDLISNDPFETRLEELKKLKLPAFASVTKQIKVTNESDLDKMYSKVLALGGEGLMLRAPKAPYIHKRTWLMYKVKPDHDSEAVVVGYKPGEGKYSGLLGSLELQTPKGIKFYVSGFPDSIRKDYLTTHPIGTKITYRYTFLTDSGTPRHPRYKGIPNDK